MSKLQRALAGEQVRPDFSNEGLAAMAAEQEAAAEGGTEGTTLDEPPPAGDGNGTNAGADDQGSGGEGDAATGVTPPAEHTAPPPDPPAKAEETVTKLADGSWLVMGKYKGATLEEATNQLASAKLEAERKITSQAEDARRMQQERDLYVAAQQNAAQAPQAPQPMGVAQRLQAEQQVRTIAQQDPAAAAELALGIAVEMGDESMKLYNEVVGDWAELEPKAAMQYNNHVQAALTEARIEHSAQQRQHVAQTQQQQAQQSDNVLEQGLSAFAETQPEIAQRHDELMAVLQEHPQILNVEPTPDNYTKAFQLAWRLLPPADTTAVTAAAQAMKDAAQAAARNKATSQVGAGSLADDVGDDGNAPDAEQETIDAIRNGIVNAGKRRSAWWSQAGQAPS